MFRLAASIFLGTMLVFLTLPFQSADADELWRYVDVQCNSKDEKVSIKLRYQWNERPSPEWHGQIRPAKNSDTAQHFRVTGQIDYGECFLAAGVPVRVKILNGVAMPYGMCGADPEFEMSVWVDQRKWMSQYPVDGRCPDELVTRVELARTGMVICKASDLEAAETCSFTSSSELANDPDIKEYPVGPRGPLPGTIVTDFAADRAFCDSMVHAEKTEAGLQNWHIALPPDAISWKFLDRPSDAWDYTKFVSRQMFDIDNFGAPRFVYGYHPATHANDADIYFASPGTSFDNAWPKISYDTPQALYQQSPYIFPTTLGTCGGHPCGPADDPEEGELTLQHPSGDGTPVTFRFRYWHQTPFTWKGTTYFQATVLDSNQRHLTMVLRPKPTSFEEVCLFRRVLDNY